MHKRARPWYLIAGAVLAAGLALGIALAAEPGSKDDPLATVLYVQRHAQFARFEVETGRSLRLGTGAELVVADPAFSEIAVSEFDPLRDTLLDLTTGAPLQLPALTAGHHYLNASSHDVFIRADEELVVMLRGEWK